MGNSEAVPKWRLQNETSEAPEPLWGSRLNTVSIGAMLEYLLRGVPFDVMKVKGRWASNAFQLYLRKHNQILAPYMQSMPPETALEFTRLAMPPVR